MFHLGISQISEDNVPVMGSYLNIDVLYLENLV